MFLRFSQAPLRRQKFTRECPNIPFPPKPSIIRWRTWIDAAIYYADHFESVKSVVDSFDPEGAESIRAAQRLMNLSTLKRELAFIKRNYSCLTAALTSMQGQGVSLSVSIEKFLNIRAQFDGAELAGVREKFDGVMRRNTGFDILRRISMFLQNANTPESQACDFIRNLSPSELNGYVFAPVTSCDVERSFSSYKHIFDEKRRSFIFENLKQHLILYCNDI